MTAQIDEAVALYGTTEPVAPPVILRAGPLTAEFEAGNLRHIRVGGVEIIRAISFIVRDRHWSTYTPSIDGLTIEQGADGFVVRYKADTRDDTQSLRYRATITGRADAVTFEAEGEAVTDFDTCRTGFVVLHPASAAGIPVEIEQVDGRRVPSRFPDLIDPLQPMLDLRALTHEAAPGLRVTCRMEGDAFEMEDQRNWCDASYKTYVRPLALPWPYRLARGETLRQSVSLAIDGTLSGTAAASDAVEVSIGPRTGGTAPALGLGLDPAEHDATRRVLPQLETVRPQILVCHFDPRRGHDRAVLDAAVSVAAALGAEPWLEAIVVSVHGFEDEIAALSGMVRAMGSPFRAVHLSPAADLQSTPPGQPWPKAPPAAAFHSAARQNFPDVRLGGGMISTFTELNRKRPPLADLDFVSFTTMALVHAADDVSVIEGLEALPAMARSAKTIAQHVPVVVGPSAIGLRHNPYGAHPVPDLNNTRRAMGWNDPRQRGLLGAARAVGYYAHLAEAGVEAVVFGGTTGPFGVVHTAQDWPTPGYDREGALYPIFHVLRRFARWRGAALRAVEVSEPSVIQGVAIENAEGIDLVLANLTAVPRTIRLSAPAMSIRVLDQTSFGAAADDADAFDGTSNAPPLGTVLLASYGVVFARCGGMP